jgi:hypothetical protein
MVLATPSQMNVTDSINFGLLGPPGTQLFSDPKLPTAGGIPVTFLGGPTPWVVTTLDGSSALQLTNGTLDQGSGAFTGFDAEWSQPVRSIGFDVSIFWTSGQNLGRVGLTVFGASEGLAGFTIFTGPGGGTYHGFIGITSDHADVTEFGITFADFANHGTLLTFGSGILDTQTGPAATPEPASLVLLGFGASVLLGYGWRRSVHRRTWAGRDSGAPDSHQQGGKKGAELGVR